MSHPPNEVCTVEDCGKPVEGPGRTLCRGHRGRRQRRRPVDGQLRQWGDPRRTLMEAAFAFADASELDEDSYYSAWKCLYAAATRVRRTKCP